ncbi:hypothetical protein RHMOL_Rhmol13G0298300 [Rhododendron molle]|uniref:Uncharacterized protein n=1 Tax=Rhododendron molle TaxID=49168 RepID=A0ACC0LCP4_RHOML|nr:hypothetical protein RHMOL_Rhmol13G0298300 [Rhododendron molle]
MKTMFRFGISLFCAKCSLSRIYKLGFHRSVNGCLYIICKSANSGQNRLSLSLSLSVYVCEGGR